MQITQLKISNILGIAELDLVAGRFNTIEGGNGTGKTSVLEAIKSAVGKSEDATLLRRGSEKGEIVLVLDDGTEITKRISHRGVSTTVEMDGVKMPAPATTIKALTDMFSVNPIDFLNAPKKTRVSVLLDCLPVQADNARLSEIIGTQVLDDPTPGRTALERIDAIYKSIFDDRTGTNRAVREKESTINQLADTLPVGEDEPVTGSITELEARVAEIAGARDAKLETIAGTLTKYRTESSARVDAIQIEIDALREKQTAERTWMADTETKAATARSTAQQAASEATAPLSAQITALRQGQTAAAKAQQTRETIAQMKTEADALKQDAIDQTAQLDGLEAYKSELLAKLPIQGLAVRDGEIFRNEVPFDRLNTAQQVEIAVEIAKLRAGDLGIICVDGAELLDAEQFDIFREKALASGLQLFVTRVTNDQFGIRTEG